MNDFFACGAANIQAGEAILALAVSLPHRFAAEHVNAARGINLEGLNRAAAHALHLTDLRSSLNGMHWLLFFLLLHRLFSVEGFEGAPQEHSGGLVGSR